MLRLVDEADRRDIATLVKYPQNTAGALMTTYGLAFLAAEGFAPNGHFPWPTAAIFAAGVLLVALCPRDRANA